MILSDSTIRRMMADKRIVIDPQPEDMAIQPASIDLHLSDELRLYDPKQHEIDPLNPPETILYMMGPVYQMFPGEFLLGSTVEKIRLPSDIYARIEGKSTLGRCGLQVHITAGFIDPGYPGGLSPEFYGNITLELKNVTHHHFITLRPGMPIAQICFGRVDGRVARPYGSEGLGSRYQGSRGTVGPRKGE